MSSGISEASEDMSIISFHCYARQAMNQSTFNPSNLPRNGSKPAHLGYRMIACFPGLEIDHLFVVTED